MKAPIHVENRFFCMSQWGRRKDKSNSSSDGSVLSYPSSSMLDTTRRQNRLMTSRANGMYDKQYLFLESQWGNDTNGRNGWMKANSKYKMWGVIWLKSKSCAPLTSGRTMSPPHIGNKAVKTTKSLFQNVLALPTTVTIARYYPSTWPWRHVAIHDTSVVFVRTGHLGNTCPSRRGHSPSLHELRWASDYRIANPWGVQSCRNLTSTRISCTLRIPIAVHVMTGRATSNRSN